VKRKQRYSVLKRGGELEGEREREVGGCSRVAAASQSRKAWTKGIDDGRAGGRRRSTKAMQV
jgi:hypothetical protein